MFTTTEKVVATVVVPLINGRTYQVRFVGNFKTTVANDLVQVKIRQDNLTGAVVQDGFHRITASGGSGAPFALEAEYPAIASADKTFVVTGDRTSGTGDVQLSASATAPAYLYVNYIRG